MSWSILPQDLSVPLFISGYLAVMVTVKLVIKPLMSKYLKELMADDEVYRWEPVQDYHAVWIQQIENN